MNKKRLLKLADLLEADAKNKKGIKFDLGVVGEPADWLAQKFEPTLDCGTTACAMGLAALSGAFKRYGGLSYKVMEHAIRTTVDGRSLRYDRAAMKVFDLKQREADFLFTPSSYFLDGGVPRGAVGERYVAKRIRDFVAGKVAP